MSPLIISISLLISFKSAVFLRCESELRYLSACICVCIHMYICLCLCMCVSVCIYVRLCVCMCVRVHMFVCVRACAHVYLFVYRYVCVFVLVLPVTIQSAFCCSITFLTLCRSILFFTSIILSSSYLLDRAVCSLSCMINSSFSSARRDISSVKCLRL